MTLSESKHKKIAIRHNEIANDLYTVKCDPLGKASANCKTYEHKIWVLNKRLKDGTARKMRFAR